MLEDIKMVCSMVMVHILLDQNQNGQETNTKDNIKTTKEVEDAGGLHLCVTFFMI